MKVHIKFNLLFCVAFVYSQIDSSLVIKAQKFGSSVSTLSSDSVIYWGESFEESYFYGDLKTSSSIQRTKDQDIYMSALWIAYDAHYKLNLSLSDGNYILNLRFAEIEYDSPNERVFSMNFCGESIFEYLDIYTQVGGKNKALNIFYEFSVRNGIIQSSNYNIAQNDGMLDFEFISVVDKGIINALQIIKGTCSDTGICNNCYDPKCLECDNDAAICTKCMYNTGLNDKNYCQCNSMNIKAIINAPESVCSDCIITLDGSESYGSGKLSFQWVIDNKFYSNSAVCYYTVQDSSKTHIIVNFTISDSCGYTNTIGKVINVSRDSIVVNIISYTNSYQVNKYSTFSANYITKNSSLQNPVYTWSISPDISSSVNLNQKEITIKFPDTQNYTIAVTATFDSASATTSKIITPMPEIPIISVLGVNTEIYWTANIIFNATLLYENGSNQVNYPLNYSFIDCAYGKITSLGPNSDKSLWSFRFQGTKNFDSTCSFEISIEIAGNIYSADCYYNLTQTTIPLVYVSYPYPYFDWSSEIRFMANIPDQTNLVFRWIQTDSNPQLSESDLATYKNQSSYTILRCVTIPTKAYEFTIEVEDITTNTKIDVKTKRPVNSPPQYGNFAVNPSSGSTLETQFNVIFQNYVDPEQNNPISYQILQLNDDGSTIAITPKTYSNSFSIYIGANGNLTLLGRVYDSLGTFNSTAYKISVQKTNANPKIETEKLLNAGLNMDPTMYISKIVAISQYVFKDASYKNSTEEIVNDLLNTLNKWVSSKEMTLVDVSTAIDVISVFLTKSDYYGETLMLNITSSLSNILNQTDKLDKDTYEVLLEQIDIITYRFTGLSDEGKTNYTSLDFYYTLIDFFGKANDKYQKQTLPNEVSITFDGKYYTSVIVSRSKSTLSEEISISNCTVSFDVDAQNDDDNKVYHQAVALLNNLKDVTAALPSEFQNNFDAANSCSFDSHNKFGCRSYEMNQNLDYGISKNNAYVKPSVTKFQYNSYKQESEAADANVTIVMPKSAQTLYDTTCEVLINGLFSNNPCNTVDLGNFVYQCVCKNLGLITQIPDPTLQNLFVKGKILINVKIFSGLSFIPFIVYILLSLIYIIGLRDLGKLDTLTCKTLKSKVKYIMRKIKSSIESHIKFNEFCSIKQIKRGLLNFTKKIKEDVAGKLTDINDIDFLDALITDKLIIKQAEDAILKNDIDIIKSLTLPDVEFNNLMHSIRVRRMIFAKLYYFIRSYCYQEAYEKKIINKIKDLTSNRDPHIEASAKLIKEIIKQIKSGEFIVNNYEENSEEHQDNGDNEEVGDSQVLLNIENDESTFYYNSNSYGIFIELLANKMKNDFLHEDTFYYYFIKSNLLLGLIGFTSMNFSRRGRLTLFMLTAFTDVWVAVFFFEDKNNYYSSFSILSISEVQLIIIGISIVIGLITGILGHFLPSNYTQSELWKEEKVKYKTSKIAYLISWVAMLFLLWNACSNAGNLSYSQHGNLIKSITITLIVTVLLEGVIKPILEALLHKYRVLTVIKRSCLDIMGLVICCKKRNPAQVYAEENIKSDEGFLEIEESQI
ncbi:unnamed protein product [Blepharisma stoltei]|uniref:PKD/REJ-like domain-containing protein n=1 Tax=Blepharisma stoltei TaxID=1481888 RepID=A0AAU9ICV9_9CILI|nr:unnamed protein product [Blepharisma stoltei]